jgi:hypothetical protein
VKKAALEALARHADRLLAAALLLALGFLLMRVGR